MLKKQLKKKQKNNPMENYPRLELSHRNILYNLNHFRSKLKPSVKMLVLVKANAYGHGADILGRVCEDAGVDYLGVAFANEGIALRRSGVRLFRFFNSDPDRQMDVTTMEDFFRRRVRFPGAKLIAVKK